MMVLSNLLVRHAINVFTTLAIYETPQHFKALTSYYHTSQVDATYPPAQEHDQPLQLWLTDTSGNNWQ